MDVSSTVLRESPNHNPNIPSPRQKDIYVPPHVAAAAAAAAAGYTYDINHGTPPALLPRMYVPASHHSLGLGLPNSNPLYAQQQGGLASPGLALAFDDFDEMKVS